MERFITQPKEFTPIKRVDVSKLQATTRAWMQANATNNWDSFPPKNER